MSWKIPPRLTPDPRFRVPRVGERSEAEWLEAGKEIRDEIRQLLVCRGADGIRISLMNERANVEFGMALGRVRFDVALPLMGDFTEPERVDDEARDQWAKACDARWLAIYNCILAKLTSCDTGIETFEEAFRAQLEETE
jgi:hypothetical protein